MLHQVYPTKKEFGVSFCSRAFLYNLLTNLSSDSLELLYFLIKYFSVISVAGG